MCRSSWFSSNGSHGIQVTPTQIAAANFNIIGCHFENNGGSGILAAAGHWNVTGSYFLGNGTTVGGGSGIVTIGSPKVQVEGNFFDRNGVGTGGGYGVNDVATASSVALGINYYLNNATGAYRSTNGFATIPVASSITAPTVDATVGHSTGGVAGIKNCTVVASGATITIKGGIITAFTGC
jgi:hypothetical protein